MTRAWPSAPAPPSRPRTYRERARAGGRARRGRDPAASFLLVADAFVHELRVRYGECDPQGIVFNANYLLYCDVAFTELWRAAVGPWQQMLERGYDAVVADAHLSFRSPARFDDDLALRVLVWLPG